jgi:hypothetical protein
MERMIRDFIVWMLSFGLGVSLFLIAQEAEAATIITTASAETKKEFGPSSPHCGRQGRAT